MISRNVAVASVALAFGTAAAFESAKLPFGTVHSPGQGFFPSWISVVIILLALLLLAQALTPRPSTGRESRGRIAGVGALLVVLAGYTFLLNPLGYPLCTFFLVLFMLRATDSQRWAVALGMAAVTAIGSYVLFATWLGVPLPRGPL
ncbi:MAG: tripartite tricarboxylate transporter TctB family protein [Candidatus Binatia bacterium]